MHPQDSKFADWLDWFTGDSDATRPFALSDGRRAASDGRTAVIVHDGGPVFDLKGRPGRPEAMRNGIEKILNKPHAKPMILDYTKFVEMVGPAKYPEVVTCPVCSGTKRTKHDCDCELCTEDYEDCERCERTGKIESVPEIEPVTIWGVRFDRNRIAYLLNNAPPSDVITVSLSQGIPTGSHSGVANNLLHIETDAWHGVICELMSGGKPCPELMEVAHA